MKLYELVGRDKSQGFSPYVWRIKMALAHMGFEYETIPLHFYEIKDTLEFSGSDKVPVLVDGKNIIKDSWDIACYLEDTYPGRPSLFGNETARSQAYLLSFQVAKNLLMPLFKVIAADIYKVLHDNDKEYFRKTREPRLNSTLEEARARREEPLKIFKENLWPYSEYLKSRSFYGGSNPAYNDFIIYSVFQWARGTSNVKLLDENDPIQIWINNMHELYNGHGKTLKSAI